MEMEEQEERRRLADRRARPTRPLSRYSLRGRRKKARRKEEERNYYVDLYEPRFLFVILAILLLCVFDALLTARILHDGGEELNPVMLLFLNRNPTLALGIKYLVTAASLVVILAHKNFVVFRKVKASFFIYVIFFLYLGLVAYEGAFFLIRHT